MHSRVLAAHPGAELYGSDRIFLAVVAALHADVPLTVLLGAEGPLREHLTEAGVEARARGLFVLRKAQTRRLHTLPWRLVVDILAMVREVRRTRPAVVYVSTVTLPGVVLGARLAGARVVVHVHEAEQLPWMLRAALVLPLHAATRVLSISDATTAFVTTLPGLRRRVRRLPNTVPVPDRPAPLPHGVPSPLRLVVVGRWSERKGTDVAIRAAAVLRDRDLDVRLDLYGDVFPGYEPYERLLDELVVELDLGGVVTKHGFVPDPGPAYAAAHICVVPSRVEPFGLVAVEARTRLRPVVVSDIPGLRETVDGGTTGTLVPPDDPVALADAVEALHRTWPATLAGLQRSRERAVEDYGPERFARDVRAIFADVLG